MSSLTEYMREVELRRRSRAHLRCRGYRLPEPPDGVPALLERLDKEPSRAVRDAIFQALIRIDADAAIEGCRTLARKRRSADPQPGRGGAAHKGARSIPFLKTVMREWRQGYAEACP